MRGRCRPGAVRGASKPDDESGAQAAVAPPRVRGAAGVLSPGSIERIAHLTGRKQKTPPSLGREAFLAWFHPGSSGPRRAGRGRSSWGR
jgi:hypothetical protein